jgi:short-subunit dehydrogenase
MGGAYHASKHAVEAFSDALRYEVKPYGVAVCLVEPGPVRTPWASTAASSIVISETAQDDPYRELKFATVRTLADMTKGVLGRFASSPESIAQVLLRAAKSRHPRSRYRVGVLAKLLLVLRWILPDRVFDLLVSRTFVTR